MKINYKEKSLQAKIDQWDLQIDYYTENSIKIFIYSKYMFGNKFIGFYNKEADTIRPLYYNSVIDYRGKEPTKRQQEKIKRYCKKLIKELKLFYN